MLKKRISPPILPNVRESHIDPDYTDLPLDFEESNTNNRRMSTERRYSYYYESTLQSKRSVMIAQNIGGVGGDHHQSFFNQFFEKNDSICSSTGKVNI
jgi:hypothetical protein